MSDPSCGSCGHCTACVPAIGAGRGLSPQEAPALVGEAAPIRRHYVEGEPCDGSESCGVDHAARQMQSRSVEYGGGYWHWFCLREGCRWSGAGLLSEGGANREADRHDREYHP